MSWANGLLTISPTEETSVAAIPRSISGLHDTAKIRYLLMSPLGL